MCDDRSILLWCFFSITNCSHNVCKNKKTVREKWWRCQLTNINARIRVGLCGNGTHNFGTNTKHIKEKKVGILFLFGWLATRVHVFATQLQSFTYRHGKPLNLLELRCRGWLYRSYRSNLHRGAQRRTCHNATLHIISVSYTHLTLPTIYSV